MTYIKDAETLNLAMQICEDVSGDRWSNLNSLMQSAYLLEARQILMESNEQSFKELKCG